MFVSRIQIIGPGENNFVKWKETFRSDRLDQIRSVYFLHIKGIKTFGYEIIIEKESENISRFSKKIILKPL